MVARATLCSDAFMVFGKKSNATDNPEIREATNHLLNTVIPGYDCINTARNR
jgi:hypothetical protein